VISLNKGKRELNSDLNLTPFIDLLSTLICFLLISSVWVQVASMDLKQSHGTSAGAARESAAVDVILGKPGVATLILKMGSRSLNRTTITADSTAELVVKLQKQIITYKNLPALKNATIESVLVAPHAQVMHGDMVKVLDGFRVNGITNIGVKPMAGEK
jgi:biopolymer transport protein ExbD